jgi:MoxR-like ATPase
MKTTTYEIYAKVTPVCAMGETILNIVETIPEGKPLPIKAVLSKDEVFMGKYMLYIDEEKEDNAFSMVTEVLAKDGTSLSNDEISALAARDYEMQIFHDLGHAFKGKLKVKNEESNLVYNSKEMDDEAKRIVEDKITTKEVMDRVIKIMKDNYVDEHLALQVLRNWKKHKKSIKMPSTVYVDPNLEQSRKMHQEGIIAEGLRAAMDGHGLICEGEKSVGKNVYVETLAFLLGKPFYLITMNRQMSPSSIYGEKTTDNSASEELAAFDPAILKKAEELRAHRDFMIKHYSMYKLGKPEESKSKVRAMMDSIFTEAEQQILAEAERFEKLKAQSASVNIRIDESELYDAITDGGLLCLNEMNMAEPNFLASFVNQLLDNTGFIFIPGRGDVTINEDFFLVGTQNADYQGVELQNEATMSRFGLLYFAQSDHIKEQLKAAVRSTLEKTGNEKMDLDDKFYTQADKLYTQCKKSVEKGQISNACLNIRGFVRALVSVAKSYGVSSLKRQIEIHVVNTCPFDERISIKEIEDAIITL